MSRKLLFAAAFCVAPISTSAVAGEITGTGDPTPLQGLSWCKYSGLNTGDDPFFEQTQTYGQILVTYPFDIHPKDFNPNTASDSGEGCNAHKAPAPRPPRPGE